MPLYHFTTSCHLAWIIRTGELRPAVYAGEPRDFVHVTANKDAEPTANGWGNSAHHYRSGMIRRVRFTVADEDFEPWREVCARFPEWEPAMVERLETRMNGLQNPFGHLSGLWFGGNEVAFGIPKPAGCDLVEVEVGLGPFLGILRF